MQQLVEHSSEHEWRALADRFLDNKRGVELTAADRAIITDSVSSVKILPARTIIVRAGQPLNYSTLLLDGFMSRHIDDLNGARQLVAFHVPGDFVDLHSFPMHALDHDVATLTKAEVALVPHSALDKINEDRSDLTKKLWFSTLLDAAIHRAWLFRIGRLKAVARVAHFLCETDVRLEAVGLSEGHRYSLPITQADLAEICGLTPIHINRVVKQLREQTLCTYRDGIVEIHNYEGLCKFAQFNPYYLYVTNNPTD